MMTLLPVVMHPVWGYLSQACKSLSLLGFDWDGAQLYGAQRSWPLSSRIRLELSLRDSALPQPDTPPFPHPPTPSAAPHSVPVSLPAPFHPAQYYERGFPRRVVRVVGTPTCLLVSEAKFGQLAQAIAPPHLCQA